MGDPRSLIPPAEPSHYNQYVESPTDTINWEGGAQLSDRPHATRRVSRIATAAARSGATLGWLLERVGSVIRWQIYCVRIGTMTPRLLAALLLIGCASDRQSEKERHAAPSGNGATRKPQTRERDKTP